MKINRVFASAILAAVLCPADTQSAEVTFDGNVAGAWISGTARLGTFNPDFNPFRYKLTYGIDSAGNMCSPNYSRAVSDGNFRPTGDGSFVDGHLSGVGDASSIGGQQLWIFLFDEVNPDRAQHFALFSGSTHSWLAPSDAGSSHIFADWADVFVFGSGGRGQPVELQVLPFPEPSPLLLLGTCGLLIAAIGAFRKCFPRAQRSAAGGAAERARPNQVPGGRRA
jgi:hypothetical protein